jgi:alpha-beta hydrolase superfamily lysophospholipase
MKRHCISIPSDDGQLFGWLHMPESAENSGTPKNTVAILCNPIGFEFVHSYRSMRHLADRLAFAGIPAVRFDYHGTGDSPGSDSDPDRVQAWKRSIGSAIRFATEATGCNQVCLIGIHMGATLAALVSTEQEIDLLVLWNPVVSGRRYVREMQVIAATASREGASGDGAIESAGFLISKETAEHLKKINLLDQQPKIKKGTLILHRDDLELDRALGERLRTLDLATDERTLPGYAQMMAEPQFTEVPETALDSIAEWVCAKSLPASAWKGFSNSEETSKEAVSMLHSTEWSCSFAGEQKLFGILNSAGETATQAIDTPVVVMLNAGSVHHVGPNRLYVSLARALASEGIPSFRVDIRGLGDSVRPRAAKENHPYPDTAVEDTRLAVSFLRERFGYRRFVLLGLCSGAHTAFHAGIELEDFESDAGIADIILINPLTYRWVEGMTLETTTRHFQEVAYYQRSFFNPESWKKLLKGKVDVRYPARVLLRQGTRVMANVFVQNADPHLAQNLARLFARGRTLSLFVASQDPGFTILSAGAKASVKRAIRAKKIRTRFIENADHTFTELSPRNELIQGLLSHIGQLRS